MSTKIEYCDETINPIRTTDGGWYCVKSSLGCSNCYAEKINKRFGDGHNYTQREVKLVLNENSLAKPLKWKKPKKIFIQDMSDLFLPVNGEYFNKVQHQAHCRIIDLIKKTPQHTYMMLTKYPKEMFLSFMGASGAGNGLLNGAPLPNLWLGVTAESQEQADKRIPTLLQIPAAVRFVSVEPMLEPMDLSKWIGPYDCMVCGYVGRETAINDEADSEDANLACPNCGAPEYAGFGFLENSPNKQDKMLAWVVCGTENVGGRPGRKPIFWNDTVWDLKNQCVDAGVPFFLKQMPTGFKGYKLTKMPELDGQRWNQMPGRV